MEVSSFSHGMLLKKYTTNSPLFDKKMPRTSKMKPIIESYIIVPLAAFLDDSPTPHKTEGQAVTEKSPFDSDYMQLYLAIFRINLNSIQMIIFFVGIFCGIKKLLFQTNRNIGENVHSLAMVKHNM